MTPRRILSMLFSIAATVALWACIAPAHLGGSLSYVTIKGTSMNPGIHAGDVVVLKPSAPYNVGDVIAYRSNMNGAPILHRVIDITGDRFLMQGDNNNFVDDYRPTEADVIGQKILLIPKGSSIVAVATRPWFITAVGVLTLLFVVVLGIRAERQRRRVGRSRNGSTPRERRPNRRRHLAHHEQHEHRQHLGHEDDLEHHEPAFADYPDHPAHPEPPVVASEAGPVAVGAVAVTEPVDHGADLDDGRADDDHDAGVDPPAATGHQFAEHDAAGTPDASDEPELVGAGATSTGAGASRRRRSLPVLHVPGRPFVWLMLAALFAGVTQVAWTAPLHTDAAQTRPLLVKYRFDYGAKLPPNPVYDNPELRFGDTIFLSVVDRIDVTVGWSVPADQVAVTGGLLTVKTTLESTAGWTREFGEPIVVPIDGVTASTVIPVDFRAARMLITQVDAAAAVTGSVALNVVATAKVDGATIATGTPGPLAEETSSLLTFRLTDNTATVAMSPTAKDGTSSRSSSATPAGANSGKTLAAETSSLSGGPMPKSEAIVEPGVHEVVQWVQTAQLVPNRLALGPLSLDVRTARQGGSAGLVLFLGLGLGGLAIEYLARHRGEPAYIAALHGARLVPMRDLPEDRQHEVIDLASFEALLAMSRRLDLPIMVETPARTSPYRGLVRYYVYDGPATYRYVTTTSTRAADQRPADEPAEDRAEDRAEVAAHQPGDHQGRQHAEDLQPAVATASAATLQDSRVETHQG